MTTTPAAGGRTGDVHCLEFGGKGDRRGTRSEPGLDADKRVEVVEPEGIEHGREFGR